MNGMTGEQMKKHADDLAYEKEFFGKRDRGYTPGGRNISPGRLSNAEKMIRNFEDMPPALQQSWLKNPRNRKKLEDAYMLVETPEPPVEPGGGGSTPEGTAPMRPYDIYPPQDGGTMPTIMPPEQRPLQGPEQGPHGPQHPALPGGGQGEPRFRRTAYDDYLDSLRNRGLSGDPRTGVLF